MSADLSKSVHRVRCQCNAGLAHCADAVLTARRDFVAFVGAIGYAPRQAGALHGFVFCLEGFWPFVVLVQCECCPAGVTV